jgi:Icc-related predicted phosphoesterase
MMILAVADFIEPLHCTLLEKSALAEVRLIVSCGDLPPDYLSTLSKAFDVPLYYVRGNHDINYESSPPRNCLDIHAQIVPFAGLIILGLQGSHWYNGGKLQYHERQMRQTIRYLRPQLRKYGRLDLVLTHAAPRRIGDGEDLCHRGFESFRHLIDRYRPRYHLHGHIHRRFNEPSERITVFGQTQVINCSGYNLIEVGRDHA